LFCLSSLSELIDNKEKTVEDIISSPSKKKAKIEMYEKNICKDEDNNILSTVIEIIEKIKEVLENEVQIKPIDSCFIPIPKSPVKQFNKPCKIPLLPEKNMKDIMEKEELREPIKPKRNVVNPVVPQTTLTEKKCKPQHIVAISTKPKQKINKNEPKFKEKNSLFKYGNYNR
jgi:hypothetical protein